MSKLPATDKPKDIPTLQVEEKVTPTETETIKTIPATIQKLNTIPNENKQIETIPDAIPEKQEMPSDEIEENCVVIKGEKIEIKPTLLKYFRNKAAAGYGAIKSIPIQEFLTCEAGVFDETHSADELLFNFLVAVFDSSEFVRDNYDNIDADTLDRICKIFGRLNHIDEREEAIRKNREAQAAKR